jgi:hypothetical protein
MTYLMSPDLFNQLTCVQGFTNLNGKNYVEHILMVLKDVLTEECKKELNGVVSDLDISSKSIDILKKYNIDFTHKY